jgi:hypothetical protein
MAQTESRNTLSTILKHDKKDSSYKIALLRAINDVVLSFPDLRSHNKDVAIPLRVLSEFWIAYYWPFVDKGNPIMQRPSYARNDMAFRPELTKLRLEWEKFIDGSSRPSDGFYLINELRVERKRDSYPSTLLGAYEQTIKKMMGDPLHQPIWHAGPGEWEVFNKPVKYDQLGDTVVSIPGTKGQDKCLVVRADLWQTFRNLSLWIEALCLHEWCLFTETVKQLDDVEIDRGDVYRLLTARPDNRRPLTWERNRIDLLIMEGKEFICPWTEKRINRQVKYDLDHLLPISVFPTNELWNLVPTDPRFNQNIKRSRLPSLDRLAKAEPHLVLTYAHYGESEELARALWEDVSVRFSTVERNNIRFPQAVAKAVVDLLEQFASSRNLARF